MMRLIDANELRDKLQNLSYDDWNQGVSTSWAEAYSKIADMINDIPTINAEPIKIGHWIYIKGSNGKDYRKCSECLHTQEITGLLNYCPVCGARMEW